MPESSQFDVDYFLRDLPKNRPITHIDINLPPNATYLRSRGQNPGCEIVITTEGGGGVDWAENDVDPAEALTVAIADLEKRRQKVKICLDGMEY